MNNTYKQMSGKYKAVEIQTQVETGSSHELIELLLQGARTQIARSIGDMQRKDTKEKGEHIGRAIEIIDGLKMCLDHEKGGEVAANLQKFYQQIQTLLLNANLKNDESLLYKSNELLAEILEAWKAIKPTTEAT